MKPKPLSLQEFIANLSPREKPRFAKLARTTVAHLAQLAGGHRRASPELAQRLVSASEKMFLALEPSRVLTLGAVRPDIWGEQRQPSFGLRARV